MEWKDIWLENPPRNEEILFMTGNEEIHLGVIFSEEKLRKCSFYSYVKKELFDCDLHSSFEKRVFYWFPIPEIPKFKNAIE